MHGSDLRSRQSRGAIEPLAPKGIDYRVRPVYVKLVTKKRQSEVAISLRFAHQEYPLERSFFRKRISSSHEDRCPSTRPIFDSSFREQGCAQVLHAGVNG